MITIKHILIIEDEVKIARFLELELHHEGYEVSISHDGREGLNMALENTYDLLLEIKNNVINTISNSNEYKYYYKYIKFEN